MHKTSTAQTKLSVLLDLDSIPPQQMTWNRLDFANYWIPDSVNVTSWSVGTAPLLVGLSTIDTVIILFLSGICNAIPTILNGYVGSDYHNPFLIAIRSSFGYYRGYFPPFSRAALSAVWLGVNRYYGLFGMTEVRLSKALCTTELCGMGLFIGADNHLCGCLTRCVWIGWIQGLIFAKGETPFRVILTINLISRDIDESVDGAYRLCGLE